MTDTPISGRVGSPKFGGDMGGTNALCAGSCSKAGTSASRGPWREILTSWTRLDAARCGGTAKSLRCAWGRSPAQSAEFRTRRRNNWKQRPQVLSPPPSAFVNVTGRGGSSFIVRVGVRGRSASLTLRDVLKSVMQCGAGGRGRARAATYTGQFCCMIDADLEPARPTR